MPKYSIILPTFKRPDEVDTFLDSMSKQQLKDFEVVIVDGSPDDILHDVIDKFRSKLDLKYFHEKGLGASESRNMGCENAVGEYLIFIDSDCIVPSDYLQKIDLFLQKNNVDGFGGPDAAHPSFSPILKAINYTMTSFFTTGGIRGKKKHVGKFQLRGFNMGVKREAFFAINGFSGMQVGEDIDFSMRLHQNGYTTALIPEAFVYHKRKSSIGKFYKQMYMYGKGRIDLYLRHNEGLKLVHLLPSFFVLYLFAGLITLAFSIKLFYIFIASLILYALMVFIDSTIQNKSIYVGLLSIITSFEQFWAYGIGLIRNVFVRLIFRKGSDSIKATVLKE